MNVAIEKNGSNTAPVANMLWCPHHDRQCGDGQRRVDHAVVAEQRLRLNAGMTSVIRPKNGSATM
jgi:hypothetical protein